MAIEYTEEKRFTVEQVEALFKSVGWESAQWPERLFKALQHSDTVISAPCKSSIAADGLAVRTAQERRHAPIVGNVRSR